MDNIVGERLEGFSLLFSFNMEKIFPPSLSPAAVTSYEDFEC